MAGQKYDGIKWPINLSLFIHSMTQSTAYTYKNLIATNLMLSLKKKSTQQSAHQQFQVLYHLIQRALTNLVIPTRILLIGKLSWKYSAGVHHEHRSTSYQNNVQDFDFPSTSTLWAY